MHEIQIHYERPLLAKDVFYQIKLEYQSVRYLSSVIQRARLSSDYGNYLSELDGV